MGKHSKPQPKSEPQSVRIDDIVVIQIRAQLSQDVVVQYRELIPQRGACPLPPIIIYRDPKDGTLRCPDGHHRIAAYKAAQHITIPAIVQDDNEHQAILHAVRANATHGLPRTNEDKRRAVQTLLDLPAWTSKSSRLVARQCSVSHVFVEKVRNEHSVPKVPADSTTKTKDTPASTGNVTSSKRTGQDGKQRVIRARVKHPPQKVQKVKAQILCVPDADKPKVLWVPGTGFYKF